MSTIKCETLALNDGNEIPAVGLGTFQGAYTYESVDDMVMKAVSSAVDIGYRHFDTSPLYNTEGPLGAALRKKIDSGAVKRQDIFVGSKLWCTDHATKDVVPALKRTLASLGFDYIDLWLVHWPCSMPNTGETWPLTPDGKVIFNDDDVSLLDTWKGMEECVRLGLAKSIGVSNFNIRQLKTILEAATILPAVNQVERHAFFGNAELVQFCRAKNIHISCYSPLGKINRPWKKPEDPVVFDNPVLTDIGKKYNKLAGQVALRYEFQCGNSVLPKSSNADRQRQNLDIFNFSLNEDDMKTIKELDQDFRMLYLKDKLGGSKEYPF